MIKVICLLLSFYFAKTLCKNFISISIDKDNTHKDSNEESEEKKHNNINIEIHNSKNKTHENGIPISSFSGSLETYEADKELQSNINEARKVHSNEVIKQQKTEPGSDNIYFQNTLSSCEETKSLKLEQKNDGTYQVKLRARPNSDSKFSEKMQVEPQSDEIHFNKTPKRNTENMKAELNSDCDYYNKMQNEYTNTMRATPHRDNHFTDKIHNNEKYSVKVPSKAQRAKKGNEKVLSVVEMRANTKPYVTVRNYIDKISKTYRNSVNVWEKHSDNDKMSKLFKNTEKAEPHGENKYKEKLSNSFGNLVHTRSQPRIDNYQKPSSSKENTGIQIEPENDKFYKESINTFHKIPSSYSAENIGTIDDVESKKKYNQEKLPSSVDDVETTHEYQGLAIATKNSTIEVSDRGYQENMHTQESDDEDHSSLADYPYSVSVQRKGAHYASGALVGAVWVLSTAAEFYNVRETIKLFRMRVGTVDCKKGGVVTLLKTITIHPSFVPGQPAYDISILRMAEQVPLSSLVKPIGLSRVAGKVMSAKFLTTYWPRIVGKQGVVPPTAKERVKYNSMRVSTQKLIPSEECANLMVAVNVTLNKNSLCLKPVKVHHSDCMPDIGAPVVAVDGLWGITSGWVSPLCPHTPMPTLFTRVSTSDLRTWINSKMHE